MTISRGAPTNGCARRSHRATKDSPWSADGERTNPGFAGLAIGLTLALVHLVGIPLDSTSVNPARSIGPALFQGGEALSQLWLFVVAPLVGAIVAAGLFRLLPAAPERRAVEPA